MANPNQGLWQKYPGMTQRMITLTEEGKNHVEAAAMLSEQFGVHVTHIAVNSKLCRMRRSGKGATIDKEFLEPKDGFATNAIVEKSKHPTGWEPRVEVEGDKGALVSEPTDQEHVTADSLLQGGQLDPKEWEIDGPIGFRKWMVSVANRDADGKFLGFESKWNWYYKAALRRRTSTYALDIEQLADEVRQYKPSRSTAPGGDAGYVANVADLQVGKGENGGSTGIVLRTIDRIYRIKEHATFLRKMGQSLGTLYLNGMGDMLESCDGQYAMQLFTTDLNHREQMNVTRRVLMKGIKELAPLFQKVVISAVGGNHGERRKDGKAFTETSDNDDVSLFDQLQDICAENPSAFEHVRFNIPDKALALTLDVYGKTMGLTHGHLAKSGADALAKQLTWLQKQALGQQDIADADIFVTAHYHHYGCREIGSRIHFQCPSMDGGSQWYMDATGQNAKPGLLVFVAGKNVSEHGWDHARVL